MSVVAALTLSAFAPAASAEPPGDESSGLTPEQLAEEALAQQALAQEELAQDLGEQLGERAAGAVIDPGTGELTVNVIDDEAAAQVRAAGAEAEVVAHSLADLERAQAELDPALAPDGVAWAVDVQSNSLVISVPRDVSGARADAFVAEARTLGVPVTVETVEAAPELAAFYGGETITSGRVRCSSAFAARTRGGSWYMLTAGHCGDRGSAWYDDGRRAGTMAASTFPGSDFAAIAIPNPGAVDPRGAVKLGLTGGRQNIVDARRVPVGARICKSGSTTGVTCGTVRRYGVTVRLSGGGVLHGMAQANLCTEPGDSGSAVYAGNSAQGIVSASTPGCGGGTSTWYQPIGEVLRRYGLRLE